jgi:hypothetical protein
MGIVVVLLLLTFSTTTSIKLCQGRGILQLLQGSSMEKQGLGWFYWKCFSNLVSELFKDRLVACDLFTYTSRYINVFRL